MKKNLIFVLLVAVIAFNINSNPAEAASRQMARPGLVLEEFVFESSPFFRSCHSATVLELPSGELLCAFFSGTRESHPDVEIP
jgi:predicted neuraminidase